MSWSELVEWSEYLSIYPLHEDRSEIQLAKSIEISSQQFYKKALDYRDFMITYKKPEPKKLTGKELEKYIFKAME